METKESVFCLNSSVVIEQLEDGILVLQSQKRWLFQANATAYHILAHTDGEADVAQIAEIIARDFDVPLPDVVEDVQALYVQLAVHGLVEPKQSNRDSEEELTMKTITPKTLFVRNPDVILREADQDGGLLFNPDTNNVKVINSTGLVILNLCDGEHTLPQMLTRVQELFEGAPENDITNDLQTFLDAMISMGFVGIVEFAQGD